MAVSFWGHKKLLIWGEFVCLHFFRVGLLAGACALVPKEANKPTPKPNPQSCKPQLLATLTPTLNLKNNNLHHHNQKVKHLLESLRGSADLAVVATTVL